LQAVVTWNITCSLHSTLWRTCWSKKRWN